MPTQHTHQTAHMTGAYVRHFGYVLLKTKRAMRSNSVRARLFHVLIDTVAFHRDQVHGSNHVFDEFRNTSPFSDDEQKFKYSVSLAIASICQSQNLADISRTLLKFAEEARDERVLEKVVEMIQRQTANDKITAAATGLVREWQFHEELDAILTPRRL